MKAQVLHSNMHLHNAIPVTLMCVYHSAIRCLSCPCCRSLPPSPTHLALVATTLQLCLHHSSPEQQPRPHGRQEGRLACLSSSSRAPAAAAQICCAWCSITAALLMAAVVRGGGQLKAAGSLLQCFVSQQRLLQAGLQRVSGTSQPVPVCSREKL